MQPDNPKIKLEEVNDPILTAKCLTETKSCKDCGTPIPKYHTMGGRLYLRPGSYCRKCSWNHSIEGTI